MGKSDNSKTFAPYKGEKKQPFLDEFKKHGLIGSACKNVNIGRSTVQRWRHEDPEFAQAFVEADMNVTEALESTAMKRAVKDSDTLLIFLLKARHPEKYKERFQHEIDPKLIESLVTKFIGAIKKVTPDFCPGCNTHLGLSNKIAQELKGLSEKVAMS